MKRFGVIGAGTMGSGIAQKIAIEGFPVTVVDVSDQALDRGRKLVEGVFEESLQRKILNPDRVRTIRESMTFTLDFQALGDADLVIEAVFEDLAVKKEVFARLEGAAKPGAVLATNTSSFPIAEMARWFADPGRFLGLHFFYHPVKNRLLEIVPGTATTPAAVEQARAFCALLGKVDIVCHDSPGFVVNRFFVPWLNEAVRLLAEGAASLDGIEAAGKKGFKLGMGPFALMNATGVPIAAHAASGLEQFLGAFYRPDPLLAAQAAKGAWTVGEEDSYSEAVFHRLLAAALVVAATLVEEGSGTPQDVDLGARVGLRWPRGPFALFNQLDGPQRAKVLQAFKDRYPAYPFPKMLDPSVSIPVPAVSHERRGDMAMVALARPDRSNALDGALFQDLDEALTRHGDARTVILRGKGKDFAAGADVRFFIGRMEQGKRDEIVEFTRGAQRVLARIEDHPGKVVAAVDGYALGGGAEMMLCADVIAATPRAAIGFPETGIGIYPGLGGTFRLGRRVGAALAKYLIGTGQMVGGVEAESIGLVDHCLAADRMTPDGLAVLEPSPRHQALPPKWEAIARFMADHALEEILRGDFSEEWQQKIQKKFREKAPIALALAMTLIDQNAGLPTAAGYANELERLVEVFSTEDALAGLKSIGKGRPQFHGR